MALCPPDQAANAIDAAAAAAAASSLCPQCETQAAAITDRSSLDRSRTVLIPTLGLTPGFQATFRAYCQLVRRPADRLLVVDMQGLPQNRLLRLFPYSLYELSPGQTQQRAELALQTASEKTDRLRELMEQHGVAIYTYSLRLYNQVTATLADLCTENKADALVIGREFDLGRNFVSDLAKLVPSGLIILP